jgi:hypothetical protein
MLEHPHHWTEAHWTEWREAVDVCRLFTVSACSLLRKGKLCQRCLSWRSSCYVYAAIAVLDIDN